MTTASYKNYSALEAAELRVREAGEWLKLEDGLIETIVAPRRIIEVAIPFRRDDGTRGRGNPPLRHRAQGGAVVAFELRHGQYADCAENARSAGADREDRARP